MGFLDFLQGSLWESFFKTKKEPEINYDEIIANCWNIFREGLKNPNPAIRRSVEEAVWYIDTPEGKRFFAAGMEEPDIENKAYCLQKLYERGGWRLSENILKIAFYNEELALPDRENLIFFLGGFSDPNAIEFLKPGLENPEERIRIATLCAMAGVKNGTAAELALNHLEKSDNEEEKFACALVLYQYNKPEGKPILDRIFSETDSPRPDYLKKLIFLDFNKAQVYFNHLKNSPDPEIKKAIIEMITDNRGIDFIKEYLNDPDPNVAAKAIDQAVEIGSRSTLDIIKTLKDKPGLEKKVKPVLAFFGDKEAIRDLEEKARKATLADEHLEDLKNLAMIQEQNVSKIIDTLLEQINSLDTISKEDLEKVNKAIEILIKYGKISSIPVVSRYIRLSYLENEDLPRWEAACKSAAAVLCIVERNTTYYTLYKKNKEQLK
jgi:HEAT repeat protein